MMFLKPNYEIETPSARLGLNGKEQVNINDVGLSRHNVTGANSLKKLDHPQH
jgi:hypothetical protein